MKTRQIRIGCSGWYYRHWKGPVYPEDLPTGKWFQHYRQTFDTVELNAPFYHWPRASAVQGWARRAEADFRYTIKVNRLITHFKRFHNTRTLVRDFCQLAGTLGDRMGCFIFQLPPGFHYSATRLREIIGQLDSRHRNVVEFRHVSWWNPEVFATFRERGLIFCSVSAPRLPDDLVKTSEAIYVRFHGATQWYRHDYSDAELREWAGKIRGARAKEVWAYFNNDFQGCAFRNAQTLKHLLQ